MPTIDYTIHVGEICMFVGGVWAFLWMFIAFRDTLRDLVKAVGRADPPSGLIGDVKKLSEQAQEHRDALADAGWLNRRIGQADRRGTSPGIGDGDGDGAPGWTASNTNPSTSISSHGPPCGRYSSRPSG